MEKDNEVTEVKFYIAESKEIIAFFPKEHYYFNDHKDYNEVFTSYVHLGQHTSCSKYYIAQCKEARPKEFADLQKELEGLGHNLKVLNTLKDFPAASLSLEQTEILINSIYTKLLESDEIGLGEIGECKDEATRIVTEWGQQCNIELNY